VADFEISRDLLEKQVLDKDGEKVGRVDGVTLRLRPGKPPEIEALEIGMPALLRRFGPRPAEAAARWERRLGVASGEPLRIEPARIRNVGNDVEVDLDGSRTNALAWERWIRTRFISRIPGAGKK
jgi:sporulation protein YlmC with PRC-barrel domain